MKEFRSLITGLIIIAVGVIALLSNFELLPFHWYNLWFLIFWILGISFEFSYFSKKQKDPGILVPAGIFLTYGVLFTICVIGGWQWMSKLWPLFIMGPAVGLFQLYLFGNRENALFVPIGILGGISISFLMTNILGRDAFGIVIPIIIILFGIGFLVSGFKKGKD